MIKKSAYIAPGIAMCERLAKKGGRGEQEMNNPEPLSIVGDRYTVLAPK